MPTSKALRPPMPATAARPRCSTQSRGWSRRPGTGGMLLLCAETLLYTLLGLRDRQAAAARSPCSSGRTRRSPSLVHAARTPLRCTTSTSPRETQSTRQSMASSPRKLISRQSISATQDCRRSVRRRWRRAGPWMHRPRSTTLASRACTRRTPSSCRRGLLGCSTPTSSLRLRRPSGPRTQRLRSGRRCRPPKASTTATRKRSCGASPPHATMLCAYQRLVCPRAWATATRRRCT
mmetsp:Transcript_7260/g.19000  ORF Transcript_7260/g.19000 Transcript_7260/m.19000 type:complete len:235 (-) Transcript_7260:686-1390(-)